jgi:hypothetical protein
MGTPENRFLYPQLAAEFGFSDLRQIYETGGLPSRWNTKLAQWCSLGRGGGGVFCGRPGRPIDSI